MPGCAQKKIRKVFPILICLTIYELINNKIDFAFHTNFSLLRNWHKTMIIYKLFGLISRSLKLSKRDLNRLKTMKYIFAVTYFVRN